MAERTKNLCAQLPESLHTKVREKQGESGKTLSEYMTQLITEFYEMEGKTMAKGDTKTVAFQVTPEMFERLNAYLKAHGLKKNAFFIDFIQRTLDKADATENS